VPFTRALYSNDAVMRAFYNALSDHGIIVMQVGQSVESEDPDESFTLSRVRAETTKLLTRVGFQSIHAYEEVSSCLCMFVFHCSTHYL